MDFYSFKNQCARMVVIDFAHHNKNVVSQHKFLYEKAQKKFFMSNTTR